MRQGEQDFQRGDFALEGGLCGADAGALGGESVGEVGVGHGRSVAQRAESRNGTELQSRRCGGRGEAMFTLPLLVPVMTVAYTHDECAIQAREIRAALALCGHNQKTAAAVMGLSESQVCRLIQSGTVTPVFRRLGPQFWQAFVRLTGDSVREERTA